MQTVADLQLFHVLKYTITGNKYKFAQIVQETATNVHKFGQLLYKIITQYSRQCFQQFQDESMRVLCMREAPEKFLRGHGHKIFLARQISSLL